MSEETRVCANIGPKGRRQRMIFGIVLLAVSLALWWWLAAMNLERLWRLALFAPLFMSMLGIFQAQARTCVALAAKGVQDMDDGVNPVEDQRVDAQLRKQARQIYVRSILVALPATVLFYFFP